MRLIRKFGILLGLLLYITPALAVITPPGFVGRVGQPGSAGDPTLTLSYNYLIDSGSTIAQSVLKGPVPTFTRASNAMSFDSSGNLAYAPHQLLENANLGTRTADVPSGWAEANATGDVVWTDIGSYSQALWSGITQRRYLTNATPVTAAETYTAFVYIEDSAVTAGATTILDVTSTSGTDADIKDEDWDALGGVAGWYAVGFTMGAADTNANFGIGFGRQGNATGSVAMSRPGIVKGLIAGVGVNVPAKLSGEPLGRWIGTDDGDEPLYDQPRFAHDPADSNAQLGLLMKEQRTNLALQSEAFDVDGSGSPWTHTRASISANAVAAPDGNTTADELVEDGTASATHFVEQTISFTSGNAYTFTEFAKKNTRNNLRLTFNTAAFPSGAYAVFNFNTGVVVSAGGGADSSSITDVGGGWYRASVTATADATTSATVGTYLHNGTSITYNGDGSSGLYIWGADVELGAFPTSYIPTTTAQVARAKDVASTTDVSWFNESAGTFVAATQHPTTTNTIHMAVNDTSDTDHMRMTVGGAVSTKLSFETINSGDTNGSATSGDVISTNQTTKFAAAYADDDIAVSMDGATVVADSSAGIPLTKTIDELHVGASRSDDTQLNGYFQSLKYYNVRKPNAFLISETTISHALLTEVGEEIITEAGEIIIHEDTEP